MMLLNFSIFKAINSYFLLKKRMNEALEQITKKNIQYLCFRSLDPTNSGEISEEKFRKIMKDKEVIRDEDIEEMIEGD